MLYISKANLCTLYANSINFLFYSFSRILLRRFDLKGTLKNRVNSVCSVQSANKK